MRPIKRRTGMRMALYLFTVVVLIYVIIFMDTPYVVYRPGSASEVAPMIRVENADPAERGTFMMTTVSASYANVALLAVSWFDSNAEIIKKKERLGDQSEAEYAAEQVYYMSSSQSNAVEAAYSAAGVPYKDVPEYTFVFSVPEKGNQTKLRPGDKILAADGDAVRSPDDLTKALAGHGIGDRIEITVGRGAEKIDEEITLVPIQNKEDAKPKPGLGVTIGAIQKVEAAEQGRGVRFTSTEVGGPSAGLMFTLEIYNRLTPGDLSKGYRVAGTGTMDAEGTVGAIGGIAHKIVAADRKGADFFFVPARNYDDAKKKADAIGTKMKLIRVDRLQDALDYLKSLPVKS
ncbi:SepM family pheromone-processing serine protease [Paenibacillus spiritus]|nr:SepM family pheromone-processing serine protease [Paenibacillus spiritus]